MTRLHVPAATPLATVAPRLGRSALARTLSATGVNTSTSTRSSVTAVAAASAHTKGAWTEVVASVTAQTTAVMMILTAPTSAPNTDFATLVDIGVGGAGSETAIVSNIGVGRQIANAAYLFPVWIPIGSRVAFRCQSRLVGGQPLTVAAAFLFLSDTLQRPPVSSLITMGADTAHSRGVDLAVPGGANTKGAWTEITAATTQPLRALVPCIGGGGDATYSAGSALFDIGVGAAGSETVVVGDVFRSMSSAETISPQPPIVHDVSIPAGSRIAARYQTTLTSNLVDMVLIGVPA